jgi:DeoR family fructose operon transcriptional repressor
MARLNAVPADLRRLQILETIRRRGGATVAELARDHAVSTMTAHRDLGRLARDGLIERVRGGARALESERSGGRPPTAWDQRAMQASAAKEAIARRAATMVTAGATVFLDASSTALALARRLAGDAPYELTLVTNSPSIVAEVRADALHIVVCPGELDQHTRAISGRWTVEFLRDLRFDIAFLSAAAITVDAGLTTARGALADVCNAARGSAERTIMLIDATKFGRAALVPIAGARDPDVVITDASLDGSIAARYREAGVALEIAEALPSGGA